MVDHAGSLVAVWNGVMGGTGRTVRYAEKLGRRILRFDPGQTPR